MSNYDIFTDSACDLPKEMVEKYNLKIMQMEVTIDNNPPLLNRDIDIKDFYNQLRNGSMAKTAAVTPGYFEENMRESLKAGNDIIYVSFASVMSVTHNNAAMMMDDLREEFPDRKMYCVDSKCASLGQGFLIYQMAKQRENGATIEEVKDFALELREKIHHQVTADDLFFLKRGGRINTTTAVAGTMLKIKPMIVVDEEGHLVTKGNARGRKNALKELVTRMKANADTENLQDVFISHSDCLEEAQKVAEMVKEEYPQAQVMIDYIGPVIGAHTGPGTIALFYIGTTTKGM